MELTVTRHLSLIPRGTKLYDCSWIAVAKRSNGGEPDYQSFTERPEDLEKVNDISLDFIAQREIEKAYVVVQDRQNSDQISNIVLNEWFDIYSTFEEQIGYCRQKKEVEVVINFTNGDTFKSNAEKIHLYNSPHSDNLDFRKQVCRLWEKDIRVREKYSRIRGSIEAVSQPNL